MIDFRPSVFVAMGANLGANAGKTLEAVVGFMPEMGISPLIVSPFYRTPAIGPSPQPDFVNAVIRCETAHSVLSLMETLHRIETIFGRVRRERWGPRVLDLDLIDYQGIVIPPQGPQGLQAGLGPIPLTLPHPGVSERAFVLLPLADIAPKWRHPVSGESVSNLIARLPASALAGISRLDGVPIASRR